MCSHINNCQVMTQGNPFFQLLFGLCSFSSLEPLALMYL
uniref:Uncharacterized protein n=1 Tax=Rhizophora mucronata TaxID=61149 RepID=A0A2P2J9R9_RHIMU